MPGSDPTDHDRIIKIESNVEHLVRKFDGICNWEKDVSDRFDRDESKINALEVRTSRQWGCLGGVAAAGVAAIGWLLMFLKS